MKKFISRILIALLAISMLLPSAAVAATQEITSLYGSEVTTFNYLVTTLENEYTIAANCIDTLIENDRFGVVKPSLAESWAESEDGLKWTFTLRKGVKWVTFDGTEYGEVKAQDFVDAAKYILTATNESKSANILYSVVANAQDYYDAKITDFAQVGVKAIDDYTLEYTLTKRTPYFLSMLTYVCFMPVNGAFLAEVGEAFGTDNTNILYNGAYIMETFSPQVERIYVANPTYWDKDNVFIQKITSTYNKEASTIGPEMFARGQISSVDIPTTILDEWMKDPAKSKMVRPNRTSNYTYFYAFNFDPLFDAQYEPENWKVAVNNLNFRKSIFHGLDRLAAMTTAEPYNPALRITNTITPANFVDLNGVDYTAIGDLAKIKDTDSFNEAQALEFKAAAIEELNGKATFPVKVLMPYNPTSTEWAQRCQVVEQQLEGLLGTDYIDIIVEAGPATGFLGEVRRAGKYALLECNWGPDYADPETYSDPFVPDATYNWPHKAEGYAEANGKNVYENLVDAAKAEIVDMTARYEAFAKAEAYFIDQAFVIPYGLGGGGYTASLLNPFESQFAQFGVSSLRYKGQKVMDAPMDTEEYNKQLTQWVIDREAALKAAGK